MAKFGEGDPRWLVEKVGLGMGNACSNSSSRLSPNSSSTQHTSAPQNLTYLRCSRLSSVSLVNTCKGLASFTVSGLLGRLSAG